MNRRLRTTAIVTVCLLLATVLLEWTLDALNPLQVGRLADFRALLEVSDRGEPAGPWRMQPGLRLLLGENDFVVNVDADGFRAAPESEGSAADGDATNDAARPLRIVAIGDGAIFGWGVDSERTALHLLQRDLQQRLGSARLVEILNLAHPFHTARELEPALRIATEELKADSVLVFGRAAGLGLTAELRAIRDQQTDPRGFLGRLMPTVADLASGRAVEGTLGENPESIAPLGTVLGPLGALREAGHRVAFVTLGARPQEDVVARCAAAQVPVILADAEAGVDPGSIVRAPVFLDVRNRWPNAGGHRRIAEALSAALRYDEASGQLEVVPLAR